jgi:hypothetical protein
VPERGRREVPAERGGEPAVRREVGEDARMVGGIDDDADRAVVLRRGTQHRRPADVDHLDDIRVHRTRRDGALERVEVHDDEVDRVDAELRELCDMVRVRAVRQDAGVDARVERLHAPTETLREAGEVRDLDHLDPRVPDGGRS